MHNMTDNNNTIEQIIKGENTSYLERNNSVGLSSQIGFITDDGSRNLQNAVP